MLSIFHYSFIQNAFFAGTVVAVVAGAVGYFLVTRGLTFAGHALSHIGFAGAAAALLIGVDPIFGMLAFTILAGAGIGIFGKELREEDVNIGIVMTLALGLGALFISLYNGYAEQAYSILFGTILGISRTDVLVTLVFGIGTLVILAAIFRPLLFSSIDPEVAEARGVPTKALSIIFMFLLAITVAEAIQVVGVLLVFALIVAPAAAAQHLTRKPFSAIAIAIALGIVFTWGGLLLALATSWPVSFYIASLSALTYFAAIRIGHFVHPHARAHENHPGREIKTV